MEDNKIYVFLSHSHLDYEKVRIVRDILEREGFRPLLFFLKCLEKEGYEELTKTLIREEIDSRQRFILCNSENANDSDWVKFEVRHIKETNRPYEIVDLNWSKDKIENTIKTFKQRSTVFLSYPSELWELAEATNKELILNDFRTFYDKKLIMPGDMYEKTVQNEIEKTMNEGYVLVFINEKLTTERFQYREILIALQTNMLLAEDRIIPIWASETMDLSTLFRANPVVFNALSRFHGIDVCQMDTQNSAEKIVSNLIEIDIKKNQL